MFFVARIDIAGGWTDTPPQAYEWGGNVVTLAIKIDDEVCVCVCDTLRAVLLLFCVSRNRSSVRLPELKGERMKCVHTHTHAHTNSHSLKLVLVQCGSEGQVVDTIEVTELSQMLDYSQPHAPGEEHPVYCP